MSDLDYVVGDTAPSLFGALTNTDGTAFDLTGATVRFAMRSTIDRRYKVNAVAAIVGPETDGQVRYDWAAGDLDTAGDFLCRWVVTFVDNSNEHSLPANSITVENA